MAAIEAAGPEEGGGFESVRPLPEENARGKVAGGEGEGAVGSGRAVADQVLHVGFPPRPVAGEELDVERRPSRPRFGDDSRAHVRFPSASFFFLSPRNPSKHEDERQRKEE